MTTKVSERFAARLRALREQRNMSQGVLAKAISARTKVPVSKASIAKWERGGTSPSLDNAKLVADYFGVEVTELIQSGTPDGKRGLKIAQEMLENLSPALAAIKDAVQAATERKGV